MVANLGEGLPEAGVDTAAKLRRRGHELTVRPQVVLVYEDYLGGVE
jgi:hypothetical protein